MKIAIYTKLILLLLLLSVMFGRLSAQDTLFFDGDWKKLSSIEGSKYYRVSDEYEGNWRQRDFYTSTGATKSESFYKTRKKLIYVGDWISYWENGKKTQEVSHVQGKRAGLFQAWFENGNLKRKGNYEKGEEIGLFERWYEDGQKKSEVRFTGDAFNEILNYWDKDGNQSVKDGNGKFVEYFANGNVKLEGEIKNTLREGEYLVYYFSGELLEKVNFSKNKANGLHQYFYKNGKLEAEGTKKDNFSDGLWKFYAKGGTIPFNKTFTSDMRNKYLRPYAFGTTEPMPINMGPVQRTIGYPKAARRKNLEGQVICRVLVGKDGTYEKHRIMKSTHPIFQKAVEAHIEELIYTRAFQGHYPIKFWVNIPFNFKFSQ